MRQPLLDITPARLCLLATLTALALVACGKSQPDAAGAPPPGAQMPPAEVDVMTAGAASATLTDDLPGRLQATRTAQVRARVEGIVEQRVFVEGSDVKAGQLLFRIDPRTLQATADSAEAQLARAQADALVAKQTHDRYAALLADKAVSRQEFDTAVAKLKQAEADVANARATLTRARIDLANATVTAPIAGRIGRAQVTEGALVGKGEATPLATIEQIDPIYANFTQTNADVLRLQQAIKSGRLKSAAKAPVTLILEDGSQYPLPGKLLFADLAVDPTSGTVGLRAEFPNPKRELLPGTFAKVRLALGVSDGAIKVPQRAVQLGPDGAYVLIVGDDGKVAPRPVKTGGMSGGDWLIADGLKGGEKVVVNGFMKARPGAVVKPVPWTPVPAPAAAVAAPAVAPAAAPTAAPAK